MPTRAVTKAARLRQLESLLESEACSAADLARHAILWCSEARAARNVARSVQVVERRRGHLLLSPWGSSGLRVARISFTDNSMIRLIDGSASMASRTSPGRK
jgi:hypothetical protein